MLLTELERKFIEPLPRSDKLQLIADITKMLQQEEECPEKYFKKGVSYSVMTPTIMPDDEGVTKDRLNGLISQLTNYLSLPNDWDGYEGVSPKKQTVDDAIKLLSLLPEHISVPKPTLGNSGTLGFYWERENLYAEICFEGDETFWYYAEDDSNEIGEDSVFLNTSTLPDDLISFLEQF